MKKKNLIMAGIMSTLAFTVGVNAQTLNVQNDVSLDECLKTDGNICKLESNINITDAKFDGTLLVGNEVTIDLNGYTLTSDKTGSEGAVLSVLNGGSLTVNDSKGTGKITSGELTNAAIKLTTKSTYDANKVAKLTVNGGTLEGYYYAIVGNGTRHNTDVTINDGDIKGLNKDDCLGIYHPQDGKLTINGGTITGSTGIEIRSGKLVVNGGTITGTTVPVKVTPNGNGSTTEGAGIAITQHTTKLPLEVEVNGGVIKGYSAVYQSNPQSNPKEAIDKVSVKITDGTFEAINGGTVVVYSENKTSFVSGGTFSKKVDSAYVDTKSIVVEKDGKFAVVENKVIETNDDKISFESETAFPNDYTLESSVVDEETTKEVSKKVEEKYSDEKVTDAKLLALYNIEVKDGADVVEMKNGEFTIAIEISEDLQKYDQYKVVYINDAGEIEEILDAELVDGKVVFKTSHLSTYGIVGYNDVIEENPNTLDNSYIYMVLSLLGFAGLVITYKKLKANA